MMEHRMEHTAQHSQPVSFVEQRKDARTHLYYYIKVFEAKSGRLIGHIVDLSYGGAMLALDQPLQADEPLELMMEDMLDIESQHRARFTAECRWCKSLAEDDLYDAGVRFKDLSSRAMEIVNSYH